MGKTNFKCKFLPPLQDGFDKHCLLSSAVRDFPQQTFDRVSWIMV